MKATSVTFLCVNYHGASDLSRMIESLRSGSDDEWALVVVDNSQDAAESERLAQLVSDDSRCSVLDTGENLGYFGGLQYALRAGVLDDRDWVVACNVDLVFDPDFVARLRAISHTNCVLAPRILANDSSRDLNPYMRNAPTKLAKMRWRAQFRFLVIARLAIWLDNAVVSRFRNRAKRAPSPASTIYAPHGACFILPRTYFSRRGSFDYPAFMFAEELWVGDTCRRAKIAVRYQPTLVLRHYEHSKTRIWRSRILLERHRYALNAVLAQVELDDDWGRSAS